MEGRTSRIEMVGDGLFFGNLSSEVCFLVDISADICDYDFSGKSHREIHRGGVLPQTFFCSS